jgi:hypothetical protein
MIFALSFRQFSSELAWVNAACFFVVVVVVVVVEVVEVVLEVDDVVVMVVVYAADQSCFVWWCLSKKAECWCEERKLLIQNAENAAAVLMDEFQLLVADRAALLGSVLLQSVCCDFGKTTKLANE